MGQRATTAVTGRVIHGGFVLGAAAGIAVAVAGGPRVQQTVLLAASLSAVAGILFALRRDPAMDRFLWGLAAAGLLALAAMQGVWPTYFTERLGLAEGALADMSIAGAHFVLLVASVLLVVRHAGRDPGSVIDTAIFGLCAVAPLWEWVLLPRLQAIGAPPMGQVSALLDVLFLGGVLGALGRIATNLGRSRATFGYLIVTLLATLGAVTVAILTAGTPRHGPHIALLVVAFLGFGAAALHPGAAGFTSPATGRRSVLNRWNLAFLGFALAVFPIIAVIQWLAGRPADPLLFGIGSLTTVPLVTIRLGQLTAQRERAERILAHHARHDELTGLLNRRAMLEEIDDALTRVAAGTLDRVAVLFCDLNGFKPINDKYGHQAGDHLLQIVGARLATCVRDADLAARLGGDEFLLLCRGGEAEDLHRIGERVQRAIAAPIQLSGQTVVVGVSVGSAVSDPQAPLTRDALVSAADTRMYERKRQSRDRVGAT